MVPGSDHQEPIDALLETSRILLPQQVVQEDPHGIHSHRFRPSEFLVDLRRIEGLRLPHLELVNRRLGHVVAANQPRLSGVPGVCLRFRPTACLRRGDVGKSEPDQ
jgi:hypothetical protein